MRRLDLLAFDLGASNGRAVLGRFDGERIALEELHRFENANVTIDGVLSWDAQGLLGHLKTGFAAYRTNGGKHLASFGIDSWGVDFGLIDEAGNLLAQPRAYRHSTDDAMNAAWKVVPRRTFFDRTGIAAMNFNTAYQLYRRTLEGDACLSRADALLLMPDLLGFLLTGEKRSEYTNVTTTNLYDPRAKDWDRATIRALGLPERIFTPIDRAGSLRGALSPTVAAELGLGRVPFAAVGTHDTASAVAAIPGRGDFAFCSSGTWSLFGVETDGPVLTDDVYESNFSNEGTVQGGFRPLKNIMGLWPLQECRREWAAAGRKMSWDEIAEAAEAAESFRSIVDPDWAPFFSPGDMTAKIQRYCRATGQAVPETEGRIARCLFESLALKYRWAVERLERIKGVPLRTLHIVGGGIHHRILNRMAADATGRLVVTGPVEGACAGNHLMQAVALGELSGVGEAREIIRHSFDVEEYEPRPTPAWEDAHGRLLGYMTHEVTP
jgi:rhamnulokinase